MLIISFLLQKYVKNNDPRPLFFPLVDFAADRLLFRLDPASEISVRENNCGGKHVGFWKNSRCTQEKLNGWIPLKWWKEETVAPLKILKYDQFWYLC